MTVPLTVFRSVDLKTTSKLSVFFARKDHSLSSAQNILLNLKFGLNGQT